MEGIFYLPSPLLWACISNDVELVELALNDQKEIQQLIKEDPEYILDCIHVVEQNSNISDVNIVDILLQNDVIKKIYVASQSPNILIDGPNKNWGLTPESKQKNNTSKIKNIKKTVKKYL